METIAGEQELFRACEIIFGPGLDISREFLDYLQPDGIKSAYRKRAMETHPDRIIHLEGGQTLLRQHHDLFHSVQEAYENLTTFLTARENGYRLPPAIRPKAAANRPARPRPAQPARKAKPEAGSTRGYDRTCGRPFVFWDTDSLYQGELPNRRLLLGHFLYYSGLINWKTIIQALIWQRNERPRLGEIGRRFGLLSEADITSILRTRRILQPFGQAALELGLLNQAQIQLLVAHQKRIQKKFGEFFLEKQILSPHELQRHLARYQEHNAFINAQTYRQAFRR